MKVVYHFVDSAGDQINTDLFVRGAELPFRIRSVRFLNDDVCVITLEYLHGQGKADIRS